jgi:anti-sigma-K factor RskA
MSAADDMAALPPDELLAMEWALGLLDAPAHEAAEQRRRADPAFAALCDRWHEDLLPLAEAAPAVAPSPALWTRIDAATQPAPPRAPVAAAPAPVGSSWWNSLGLWRGATAAFAATALALFATRPQPAPPPAPVAPAPVAPPSALLAATLSAENGPPLATAALDPDRGQVVLAPVGAADLQGRVPELWLIPADGRPRSLGLIALGGAQRIDVPPTVIALVADGAVLAVSLEPAGGSPTGQPTGPVVATGKLARV